MAKLSSEQQEYLDQLNSLAGNITKRIITPDYAHLVELWKAFLGGFVGPEIAKLTPDAIDAKRQALMEKYNKQAIQQLLNPTPVEKIVEKIVEKPVEKIVYRDRPAATGSASPATGDTGNRRYRPSVNKISRKKREMKAEERHEVIVEFNKAQGLMDKDDDLCRQLVDQFNSRLQAGEHKSYPAQVAGYWSWLCRLVLKSQHDQEKWYNSAMRLGKIPAGCPKPVASAEFVKLIVDNQQKEKALAAHRKAYKSHMQGAPKVENKPSSIGF